MRASFAGMPKESIKFLRDLEKNNNRDWFDANKTTYLEKVKAPLEALVTAVGAAMTKFAPEAATAPGKAIYRIYRDTRFSSDKTPYKTHLAASFYRNDLGKHIAGGFYFEISHKYVGFAGGVYMPEAENLRLIRVHIMDNFKRFQKLMADKKLADMEAMKGDSLSRPPKGFPADHPAIEWLKRKQFFYWRELPAELATSPELLGEICSRFKAMAPMISFLNEPLLTMKQKRAPLESGWI